MQDTSTASDVTKSKENTLLRLEQVCSISSLCRSHVYLLMNKGGFHASITVGVRGARWVEPVSRSPRLRWGEMCNYLMNLLRKSLISTDKT